MFSEIYSEIKSLGETFPESRPCTASFKAISPKPTPVLKPSLLFNEEASGVRKRGQITWFCTGLGLASDDWLRPSWWSTL